MLMHISFCLCIAVMQMQAWQQMMSNVRFQIALVDPLHGAWRCPQVWFGGFGCGGSAGPKFAFLENVTLASLMCGYGQCNAA